MDPAHAGSGRSAGPPWALSHLVQRLLLNDPSERPWFPLLAPPALGAQVAPQGDPTHNDVEIVMEMAAALAAVVVMTI